MKTTTRRFELSKDKSSRFWEITQADESITVRYGKTGTAGQSQTKAFEDVSVAAKHVQKLITEQLGKGYAEQCTPEGAESFSVVRQASADTQEASVDSIAASGDTEVAAKFLFGGKVHKPDVIAKFWKSKSVLIIEQLVSRDANTYLQWARDLGFDGPLPDGCALGDERKLVDKWVDSVLDKRRELWERYIPKAGPVKTVQGQLLYAMTNIDNTCRTAPNGWDVYLSELEGYVFGEVDVRSNFTHLVASAFVNDASELTSSLPLPGRQQCASYYEFLKPTAYITRLERM